MKMKKELFLTEEEFQDYNILREKILKLVGGNKFLTSVIMFLIRLFGYYVLSQFGIDLIFK